MARRPNVFDQEEFQSSLRRQGCPESFISPITSDFRLFVPLVLSRLGEDGLFSMVETVRDELKLGPQQEARRRPSAYLVRELLGCLMHVAFGDRKRVQ